jgi:hypothetical protein
MALMASHRDTSADASWKSFTADPARPIRPSHAPVEADSLYRTATGSSCHGAIEFLRARRLRRADFELTMAGRWQGNGNLRRDTTPTVKTPGALRFVRAVEASTALGDLRCGRQEPGIFLGHQERRVTRSFFGGSPAGRAGDRLQAAGLGSLALGSTLCGPGLAAQPARNQSNAMPRLPARRGESFCRKLPTPGLACRCLLRR